MRELTWLFLYLFSLLVVESLGDYWRFVMRVFLVGYWFMFCGCSWDYMDSLLWDVVSGLVIDLTLSFVVGASWYICGRYFSWGLSLQVIDWICWWCMIHLVYLCRYGQLDGFDTCYGCYFSYGYILTTMNICGYLWIRFLCLVF